MVSKWKHQAAVSDIIHWFAVISSCMCVMLTFSTSWKRLQTNRKRTAAHAYLWHTEWELHCDYLGAWTRWTHAHTNTHSYRGQPPQHLIREYINVLGCPWLKKFLVDLRFSSINWIVYLINKLENVYFLVPHFIIKDQCIQYFWGGKFIFKKEIMSWSTKTQQWCLDQSTTKKQPYWNRN